MWPRLRWRARAERVGIDPPRPVQLRPIQLHATLSFAPGDDGPDPDNVARARAEHATAKPVDVRPEDSPAAGRFIDRPTPPLPTGLHGCPRCAGLRDTVQQLRDERAALRRQLARYELAATRDQQLRPSEQPP